MQSKPFLIIGHRGACGYEPENTLRSFARALKDGVRMIELDVHVCASGELVVMHDDTIDRTTNGHGEVAHLTFEQLRAFDAGKGERIPLLSEVIDLVNRTAIINIELKGPGTAVPVALLIERYVRRGWSYDDFVVSSFNHYAVLEFHTLSPKVKTGAILEGTPIGLAEFAQRARAQYAVLYHETITAELVADAHARGICVFAYTVNTVELAKKLQANGVDGIFTNYPHLFV
jgi:glycerophosphoryl diester phosphodiesterase